MSLGNPDRPSNIYKYYVAYQLLQDRSADVW